LGDVYHLADADPASALDARRDLRRADGDLGSVQLSGLAYRPAATLKTFLRRCLPLLILSVAVAFVVAAILFAAFSWCGLNPAANHVLCVVVMLL
jgi:hypothetical protein